MDGPLVSVILAAFNSQSYLEEAITSVFEQQWDPLELIVVDDGSTDGTAAVARRFGSRVSLLGGTEQGLAETRNRGIRAAHGEYLLHLDADDVLAPKAIQTLMEINVREGCDIVTGRWTGFLSPDTPEAVASHLDITPEPQRGHLPGVAIVKADVFERVGLLNDEYWPATDMEWWLRASDYGVHACLIDDVVVHRRIHGTNSSLRNSQQHRDVSLRIIRESLARKRKQAN